MKIYELECLNQHGDIERNGYFQDKDDAEIMKSQLDILPQNIKYGIIQNVIEHELLETMESLK